VELISHWTFEDVFNLALKLEEELKGKKLSLPTLWPSSYSRPLNAPKAEFMQDKETYIMKEALAS